MGKLSRVADAPSSIGDFDPQLQSNHLKYLKAVQGLDGSSAKDLERAAQACEKQCTWVRKLTRDKSVSPPLESSTPMLVIPYNVWLTLKRIPKNVKAWRNTALSKGWLVMYESSMIVVFISHTWWDREFTDETNDPTNQYDKGSPDFQTGLNKDLKYRSICRGLEDLIAECDFDPSRVHVLIDWTCIYQDDREMKMKGGRSLINWMGKCSALYVPLQECGAAFRFFEQVRGGSLRVPRARSTQCARLVRLAASRCWPAGMVSDGPVRLHAVLKAQRRRHSHLLRHGARDASLAARALHGRTRPGSAQPRPARQPQ